MRAFTYERIYCAELSSTDLRDEAAILSDCAAFRITIYDADGITPAAEKAEALYSDNRLGIAWGADATWADVEDIESGIEMWLNDADAWARGN